MSGRDDKDHSTVQAPRSGYCADNASDNGRDRSSRWEDMGRDCLVNIFSRLPTPDLLLSVPWVCKSWHGASLEPECWMGLDFSRRPISNKDPLPSFNQLLNLAVSRSQGRSTKFLLPCYRGCRIQPEDLGVIADSLKKLSVLHYDSSTLYGCDLKHLVKVMDKWSELQVLSIQGCEPHLPEILPALARGSPRLTKLMLVGASLHSDSAAAIVGHLSAKLRGLILISAVIRKSDLLLLLKGCKNLCYLRMRHCWGFDKDDAEVMSCVTSVPKFSYVPQADV